MSQNQTDRKDRYHMEQAKLASTQSRCRRKQVGCVVVRDGRVIMEGRNGVISGSIDRCCEHQGVTKPTVIHAEVNAITFCAKEGIPTNGCTIYLTLSPCLDCAKVLHQAGIKRIIYKEKYRNTDGINWLSEYTKIQVDQLSDV